MLVELQKNRLVAYHHDKVKDTTLAHYVRAVACISLKPFIAMHSLLIDQTIVNQRVVQLEKLPTDTQFGFTFEVLRQHRDTLKYINILHCREESSTSPRLRSTKFIPTLQVFWLNRFNNQSSVIIFQPWSLEKSTREMLFLRWGDFNLPWNSLHYPIHYSSMASVCGESPTQMW